MYVERKTVALTTDASGDVTGYSDRVTGRIFTVKYTADGTSPFDATADFTITAEATGETILTQTNVAAAFTKAPRQATHDTAGVASLFAAGEPVEDYIVVSNDRIKCVVAQGGNAKSGTLTFLVG